MAYHQGIVTPDVVAVHETFDRLFGKLAVLRRNPRMRTQIAAAERDLRTAYLQFNREVNALASLTASYATRRIKKRLRETSVRTDTGKKPHLRDHIRSRRLPGGPLAAGVVQIADEAELDKVINPFSPSHGPYWRAQEYGIDFSGREIRGFFTAAGGGHPWSAPQGQFAGGGGPHPIFRARGKGPAGTIQTPIKARHFIENGTDDAYIYFQEQLVRITGRVSITLGRVQRDIITAFARL